MRHLALSLTKQTISAYMCVYTHTIALVSSVLSLSALASQRVPTIRNVGRFKGHGHEISSGEVTILNSRQILIRNFTYAGTAPG